MEKVFLDYAEDKPIDLNYLYEQYNLYNKVESDAKKKKNEIKEKIKDLFDEQGFRDDYGNFYLKANDGYFKREIRKKLDLNTDNIDNELKKLLIYDEVVTFEPKYNIELLKEYIDKGLIPQESYSNLFKEVSSYAIKIEKAKNTQKE